MALRGGFTCPQFKDSIKTELTWGINHNKTLHRATKDNLYYKFAYPHEIERTITIFHLFVLSQVSLTFIY